MKRAVKVFGSTGKNADEAASEVDRKIGRWEKEHSDWKAVTVEMHNTGGERWESLFVAITYEYPEPQGTDARM